MLKVVHVAAGPADALHSGTFSDFLSQYLSKVKQKYFHRHWKGLWAWATLKMSKNELQWCCFLVRLDVVCLNGALCQTIIRPVASGAGRGARAPQLFDRSVNPISTRGGTLSPSSTMCPPGFSDLATALILWKHGLEERSPWLMELLYWCLILTVGCWLCTLCDFTSLLVNTIDRWSCHRR